MNTIFLRSIGLFLCLVHLAVAESPGESEMAKMKEDRDKAVANAQKAIDARYQASLEQLYRKALQGKDPGLDKIKTELERFGPIKETQATTTTPTRVKSLPASFVGMWKVGDNGGGSCTFEFKADGTLLRTQGVAKVPDKVCTWSKVGDKIEVVFPEGSVVAFNLPVKGGKMGGVGSHGETYSAIKER
jgi:hypothetical protein